MNQKLLHCFIISILFNVVLLFVIFALIIVLILA